MKVNSWGFFAIILTVIFITLKIVGIIAWSWWWVLAPLWIGLAIFVVIMFLFFLLFIFAAIINNM